MSDKAATASIDGVVGDDHAHRLQPLGIGNGREQHAQFLAFLDAAVAAVGAQHLGEGGDLLGGGAEVVQHAGDAVAFLGDDHLLVERIAAGGLAGGLGQQRDVLRHDARFEAGIGVGIGNAGIGELDAGDIGAGRLMVGRFLAPGSGLAHARHHLVIGRVERDFQMRQHRRQIAHHEGDFGVRLGLRRLIGTGVAAGRRFGEQALRIVGRDIGSQIGDGQRQVAGHAHEGTHAHHFMIADPADGGDADQLAGERRLFHGRQPVALARSAGPVGADAERAAQCHLDPLRQRGEIGLAVKRGENGAAHESGAAQRGQDRAGEPLYGDAAAIDEAAAAAIDRERRLVAELNGERLGPSRSICAVRPWIGQASPSPALHGRRWLAATKITPVVGRPRSQARTMPVGPPAVNDGAATWFQGCGR